MLDELNINPTSHFQVTEAVLKIVWQYANDKNEVPNTIQISDEAYEKMRIELRILSSLTLYNDKIKFLDIVTIIPPQDVSMEA